MKIFYSNKYHKGICQTSADGKREYQLDAIVKPQWVFEKLDEYLNIEFCNPTLLSENDILRAHSEKYIKALKRGEPGMDANSSGISWVNDLYEASLCSVSGLWAATKHAFINKTISGSLSTNFHHAKRECGSGFCVLNGVAVSVIKAIKELNAERVLVVDLDFHLGDGTASLLGGNDNVRIFDIFGGYHAKYEDVLECVNVYMNHVDTKKSYEDKLRGIQKIFERWTPDLIVYDAGMDAFENDRIGGIVGIDKWFLNMRDWEIFKLHKKYSVPIVFMIGGGYVKYKDNDKVDENRRKLVDLHVNTVEVGINNI